MQRQVWVFLDDADERELLAELTQTGARTLEGRFFRGTKDDARTRPETLEGAQLRANERWIHLIHPTFSRELVVDELTDGPYAGWSRLDPVRSEVLTLVRALPEAQGLGPSRLQANTHAWFGGEKVRKSGEFSRWVSDAMRLVESRYPMVGFDWLRAAPGAESWAQAGGRLHYLYKAVPLTPPTDVVHRPHKLRTVK